VADCARGEQRNETQNLRRLHPSTIAQTQIASAGPDLSFICRAGDGEYLRASALDLFSWVLAPVKFVQCGPAGWWVTASVCLVGEFLMGSRFE
jgi:hypothetical protein